MTESHLQFHLCVAVFRNFLDLQKTQVQMEGNMGMFARKWRATHKKTTISWHWSFCLWEGLWNMDPCITLLYCVFLGGKDSSSTYGIPFLTRVGGVQHMSTFKFQPVQPHGMIYKMSYLAKLLGTMFSLVKWTYKLQNLRVKNVKPQSWLSYQIKIWMYLWLQPWSLSDIVRSSKHVPLWNPWWCPQRSLCHHSWKRVPLGWN